MIIGAIIQNTVKYRIASQCEPVIRYSTPSRKKPNAPPVVPATANTLPAVDRYEVGNNSALYAIAMVLEATSKNNSQIQMGTTSGNGRKSPVVISRLLPLEYSHTVRIGARI